MADPVNLNRFRKRRAREDDQKIAAENRVRFGRTKGERDKARRESEKAAKDLAGKRID
jgi:hypothetical protein